MQEQIISTEQPDRWRKSLLGVRHSYWHTWECCSAVKLTSGLPTFLYCLEDAGKRMVIPFSERQWSDSLDIFTPAGFSGFAADGAIPGARDRWNAFARSNHYVCGYIAQHPLYSAQMECSDATNANEVFYFDLTRGRDALLHRMRPNRRNAIWRWEAAGRPYVRERRALAAFLVQQHGAFMQRANASSASFYSQETLAAMCDDPASELVGAADAEGICAVCMFTSTAWGAEAVFNVAVREGRDFAVPLIWWGAEHYMERGLPLLHLGGGIRRGDELAKAKLRYGTDVAEFNSFKQIFDREVYDRLCSAAGCDPDGIAGYFPPYRAAGRDAPVNSGTTSSSPE
jgi:hypothetical protein